MAIVRTALNKARKALNLKPPPAPPRTLSNLGLNPKHTVNRVDALPANFGEFVKGLNAKPAAPAPETDWDAIRTAFGMSSSTSGGGVAPPSSISQPSFGGGFQSPGARKYNLSPLEEAMIQGDIDYQPRERNLANALATAKATTKQGVEAQQGYGERHGANLKNIYDQLTAAMQQNAGATGAAFDRSKQGTQDIFDQLLQRQQSQSQGVQDSLRANAERLGLTAALDDPQKRLANTLSELQGFSTAQNQNIQGALSAQSANEGAYGQRQIGQAQNIGAQSQRDLQTQVANAVAQMQVQGQAAELDYGHQQSALGMQKQSAVRKLTEDIAQARTATERQDAQDAFAQYMQEQSLDMQRARLGFDVNKANQDYGLDAARLGMEQQKFALEQRKSQTSNPLEQAKLQAEIDKLNSETMNNLAGGGSASDPTNTALNRFLNTPQQGYWDSAAGPIFTRNLNSIIESAAQKARDESEAGGIGPRVDPYTIAQEYVANHPTQNATALRAALNLYYGKK